MKPVQSVLIVGGGTAGWLSAAFLAAAHGTASGRGLRITLVESPDIGLIGVGEATFPSLKGTLAAIGVDEARFLRESNATFKQGIRFNHWVRPPGTPGADHYFHPFSVPSQRPGVPELLPYWILGAAGNAPFAQAVTMQKRVADANLGPKRATDADFLGPFNYAYHFDAALFAAMLRKHAIGQGVRHVVANVERAELDADGAIASVVTREAGVLEADLYIDCTGFRAALIEGALKSPFRSMSDVLFADRAVAMQVPYDRPDAPIASYTIANAKEAGWIWDIGLQQRRGMGYVYSSRHTDDTRAEQVLREHIGPANAGLEPRYIKIRVGYREAQWVKNCVAIGLSGGFVEPIESSGIGIIEMATYLLSYAFPFNGDLAPAAKHFNEMMTGRYRRIFDFVKLHYCLNRRTDNQFWIDNADPVSVTDTLHEKLAMWRCRPPNRLDFVTDIEMYPPSSWQYVLYGMEFATDLSAGRASYPRIEEARREFEMIQQVSQRAMADVPTHRSLVEEMCNRDRARTKASALV